VKTRIARNQSVEKQFIDMLGLSVGSDARIKIRRTALDEKHHRPRITLSGMATGNCERASQHKNA
jgi:hypothetical protein